MIDRDSVGKALKEANELGNHGLRVIAWEYVVGTATDTPYIRLVVDTNLQSAAETW